MILSALLSFIAYAILEGQREGMYWHFRLRYKKTGLNEHFFFTIQRAFVVIGLCLGTLFAHGPISAGVTAVCLPLVFSFFHNGMYYTQRNELSPLIYKKRWWDQSESSTAKLTKFMTPVSRSIQAFVGISGMVTIFVLTLLKLL